MGHFFSLLQVRVNNVFDVGVRWCNNEKKCPILFLKLVYSLNDLVMSYKCDKFL
jgi:hypothetical protein